MGSRPVPTEGQSAEGSIALGSCSPSCSPPVLLFPACSTALVKPCPRLHCRTPVPPALQLPLGCVGKGAWAPADRCSPPGAGSWLSQQLRCYRSSRVLFWAACSFTCWHGASCPAWSCSLSSQDDQIERERSSQRLSGGCCALAAVYLMGKFYVANAGDSRYGPAGQPPSFTQ